MKRLFDLFIALAIFIPCFLVSILCLAIIFLEIRANPLFTQVRVGQGRKNFTMIKLRTMQPDTRHAASHEISSNTITKSGRFLRRIKLDELPQIWNVIRGEMSFVGPRPCLPTQRELLEEREKRGVYTLRPGITGPAQLAGIDMSTPAKLAIADSVYLNGWSVRRDIRILCATVMGRGNGDAVKAD